MIREIAETSVDFGRLTGEGKERVDRSAIPTQDSNRAKYRIIGHIILTKQTNLAIFPCKQSSFVIAVSRLDSSGPRYIDLGVLVRGQ